MPAKKHGFTLIEVLLSIFMIVTLAALLLTASGSLVQTHSSNLQTIATKIATKQIESLRNTAYASLPATGTFSDPDLSKLPSGSATRTVSNYQSSSQIKLVTVTVSWVQNNNPRQINLDTLIYENGL